MDAVTNESKLDNLLHSASFSIRRLYSGETFDSKSNKTFLSGRIRGIDLNAFKLTYDCVLPNMNEAI